MADPGEPGRDELTASADQEPPPAASSPSRDGATAAAEEEEEEPAAAEVAGEGEAAEASEGGEPKAETLDGEVRNAEGEAVDGEDLSLQPSAAKKVKLELKERKEKRQKVDEDEIQKMHDLKSFRLGFFCCQQSTLLLQDPGVLLLRGAAEPLRDVSALSLPQGCHQAADPVHHWHLSLSERGDCHVRHFQGLRWGGG
ncbi:transcription initiation factor TFIID subunit 11 isoform X2 [Pogoniulus pusillus]|uniref:transcription initiation factor TFIID subunit 11 isoform X2 n=1 Tax=Pogoniulus pusillus TaxID=488313 RepID=UPI0030B967FF